MACWGDVESGAAWAAVGWADVSFIKRLDYGVFVKLEGIEVQMIRGTVVWPRQKRRHGVSGPTVLQFMSVSKGHGKTMIGFGHLKIAFLKTSGQTLPNPRVRPDSLILFPRKILARERLTLFSELSQVMVGGTTGIGNPIHFAGI